MRSLLPVALLSLVACAPVADSAQRARAPAGRAAHQGAAATKLAADTPEEVDIAKARARAREQLFPWRDWSTDAFAQARREHRFILVHGAAEWCHWCHVMEETTYRDPRVGALVRDRFVAIRVDIDSRPDLAERYGSYGWPATIVLSPDAEELGKFRGFLPAEELLQQLGKLERASAMNDQEGAPRVERASVMDDREQERAPRVERAAREALPWIGAAAARDLDDYYDEKEGGWGMRQKAALGDDVSFELRRADRGDRRALERAVFTLQKQAALIDPVWGGVYQYSAARDWHAPHFEKLMTFQAQNLAAYARAYAITGDRELLAHARSIERYLNTFLSSGSGAFLVSQDADLNAHDRKAAFVDGNVYFRLGDAERRRLGIPRIDEHVYGDSNGQAIFAMAALFEATRDPSALKRAELAAELLLTTHIDSLGRVAHDAASRAIFYLDDGAHLGLGLARLAEVSGATGARYRDAALRIADALRRDLSDERGGLFAHSVDPGASGVFARRRKPLAANVTSARLFAALWRLTGDANWQVRAQDTLAAIATPRAVRDEGRMVGTFLLALAEAGALGW